MVGEGMTHASSTTRRLGLDADVGDNVKSQWVDLSVMKWKICKSWNRCQAMHPPPRKRGSTPTRGPAR